MNHKHELEDKNILIGMGGGIAAYKVCGVISQLFQAGANVKVILTETAQAFITPLSVSTLSRHQAYTDADFWQPIHARPLHIDLGEWADILLIAPLTANTLAKLVSGLADNLLTNTVLASSCPILVAPAMNTEMWSQLSVQNNWRQLQQNPRYHALAPNAGLLACDRQGQGRMAEPEEIIPAVQSLLYTGGKQDLAGKHILISAGGTREHFDPVRFIGNPSTGKMGIALAQASSHRGATVTLVQAAIAPELLSLIPKITTISVVSAAEMEKAMLANFADADWTIMAAAVADVKPSQYYPQKLSKQSLPSSLALEPVSDIVANLAKLKQNSQKLIGFAAQTGDIVTPALDKLKRKQLDAIVANPVDRPEAGFGSDTNQGVFLDSQGRKETIPIGSKLELAHRLIDFVLLIGVVHQESVGVELANRS
jgi:phosphopantothenoylcysteine decarboxylase/phosphopantothenate--cysteine ligase